MLKEQEPVVVGRYLHVQFKKVVGKYETIPSFTNCPGSKEGRWGKERNNSIDQFLWEPPPYPSVHPWSGRNATRATNVGGRGNIGIRNWFADSSVKWFHKESNQTKDSTSRL